jgi:hypothetical protein
MYVSSCTARVGAAVCSIASEKRIPVRVSSLYHTRSIAAADVALRTAAISTMAVSALSCLRRAQYFGEGRYMANRPFINS